MPTKNMDSSFYTLKQQSQEIYANYIITNQKINQGCTTRGIFQQGNAGVFSSSQIVSIDEGAVLIGNNLRDNVLSNSPNNCPINTNVSTPAPAPPPNPPSTGPSLLSFSRSLATTFSDYTISPTSGGALVINSQAVGNFDYAVAGTTTVSSFNNTDWFTLTEDSASAWIVINGNLTINSGQTFIPTKRKLFTVVYVTGNLVCNGTISMTGRGANHSGTGNSGGYTAPVDILIGSGTFGAVTNPQIPASGGAGAAGFTTSSGVSQGYNNGTAGSSGGTGGGGSGVSYSPTHYPTTSGAGTAGTCFSGGSGGGAASDLLNGFDATPNGGKGGDPGNYFAYLGGTGNPGGFGGGQFQGNSGTGGSLIVICEGALSGTGSIQASGVIALRPNSGYLAGGGSGGGSVTVLYKTDSSSITPVAAAGAGQASGSGGAGSARKLAIGSN
jgi:hypothetical protein